MSTVIRMYVKGKNLQEVINRACEDGKKHSGQTVHAVPPRRLGQYSSLDWYISGMHIEALPDVLIGDITIEPVTKEYYA